MLNLRNLRGLALSFFAFLIVCSSQAQVEAIKERFHKSDELMVAAHRAAHRYHPENSLGAIQEAIRLGVDIVELDIRVSKDGMPLIMHDQTVDRTTTGTGDVELLNWDYLKSLNLKFDGTPSSAKIPTLREALLVCKGNIMVDMDMKTDQVDAVLEVVKELEMEEDLIFFDSDWEILAAIQASIPEAILMPRAYKAGDIKKLAKKFKPSVIHIDPSFYSTKTITMADKYQLRIWINSLGDLDQELDKSKDKEKAAAWISKGANIVQTDLPAFWVGINSKASSLAAY
ncbi:glycerophosphodiester phosphodiesterase family protein [Echinicola marina]|uniref:glycerophosphodiester phosphodiesterase family protein n=1 Tax=Echinicola marina TaxID=2859768 RepID=UPI001CF67C5A|nr:glycerophosphodiester phosphodiesterase family protein [Echinicola marina]UCS92036.1 glycerophosphodiester phosphodiesterase family protein [Echinicola marina]